MIRYGFNFNRITLGAFVPFVSLAPNLFTFIGPIERTVAQSGPFPGGNTNPLNYPVESPSGTPPTAGCSLNTTM
jgi:hypothetical protein